MIDSIVAIMGCCQLFITYLNCLLSIDKIIDAEEAVVESRCIILAEVIDHFGRHRPAKLPSWSINYPIVM